MIRPQKSSSLLLQSLCLRFLYFSLLISANESTNTCTLLHVIGGCGTPHGEKKTKKTTFASACAAEVQPGAERASVKCAVI